MLRINGQNYPIVGIGTGQPQTVSLSTVTARSNTLNSTLGAIRVWSSVNCFIRFGDSTVDATTSDHPLTAEVPEVFETTGSTHVAGIVSSGTGTLFISILT